MSVFDQVLDWIYPPRCIICDNLICIEKERWFCLGCRDLLTVVKPPRCSKCGKTVEGGTHICGDCLSRKREFTNTAIFEYDALCREVIHRFKYSSKPRYAFGLAELMIYFGAKDLFKGIDALAPVPMYVKKKNKRGYNQAEELAKALSIGCGVPVVTDFLIRTRNTAPQNKLPPERRASNLIDAFALKDKRSLESVLLIDDIYTTGETLSACGTVMKAGGVSRVSSLTLSITVKEAEDF